MPLPDAATIDDWVAAAQAGNEPAFERLVLELQGEVRAFAAVRLPSYDLVEELVQATFITAYQQLDRYRREQTFLPWLKSICHNQIRHELRQRRRLLHATPQTLERLLITSYHHRAENEAASADPFASHDLQPEDLEACLARLRPHARRLITGRYHDGLSLKELAQRLRKPATAVGAQLGRIRRSLRSCLQYRSGT